MTKDEALQMCLDYIETDAHERKYVRHAIKAALAQPAQPQRQWVGLTKEDMLDGEDSMYDHPLFIVGMVWAANKLRDKNHG